MTRRLGLAGVLWLGPIVLQAAAASPLGLAGAPEREDDHARPAELEQWSAEPTPPSEAAAEYPLAAAFDPACSCNYTPDGIVAYEHVVVHTMQGSYAGTKSWFKNPAAKVSAHYVMRSVDGEVTQMVLDKDKAWHVGSSNATSIGIEHEGFVDDPAKWYTWETYVSSARLARWLATRHEIPIDRDHIVGHVELPKQTHTDPGPGWNWELYMGLVRDVVPQGEIHVAVVDRAKACTITANVETYLRRTAEPLELLAVEELCPIAAGTPVTYLHASAAIDGRHRLLMEAGQGPCAGVGGLDAEAFIEPAHFSALCDPTTTAATGASVSLDGGPPLPVGADGMLVLGSVVEGAHTLDVVAPGLYEPASEPVIVPVYPGIRVAIAVDPVMAPPPPPPPPETTGDGGTGDGSGTSDAPTSETDDSGAPATGDAPTSGGATGDTPTSASDGETGLDDPPAISGAALPAGYGQHEEVGCGCDAGAPTSGWLLAGLGLIARRRRRGAVAS